MYKVRTNAALDTDVFEKFIPKIAAARNDVLGAGNRAVVKPSEVTPRTAKLMQELFSASWLGADGVVEVCLGGAEVASALAGSPHADHVLFVGSGEIGRKVRARVGARARARARTHTIGRKVLAAAAPNLTKCTLELGGRNPVLVRAQTPTCGRRLKVNLFLKFL